MGRYIETGAALALMKSISGAVDVNAARAAKTAAEAAASDTEAFAAGTRNGVAVGATDDAYQNNAAYYAARAAERAFAVSESGTSIVFSTTE